MRFPVTRESLYSCCYSAEVSLFRQHNLQGKTN